ncbi:glycosyltransferase [Helicobacter sp.]|uniref:glycosyltransferase n=1 Tax=Helicobacter sp. TaxID=218 RepID=UPI0025C2F532|nr:glycosyltransferase [Helicobacter sp.]MBR2494134.1 glycosyltransferase [Helicobacter sp.]
MSKTQNDDFSVKVDSRACQSIKTTRKVLLVVGDITRKGGIERVVVNLANTFSKDLGYEVGICSCFKRYNELPYELDSSVRLHYAYDFSGAPMHKKAQASKLYKLYYRGVFERVLSYKICKLARDFDFLIDNDHIYLPPPLLSFSHFPKSIKIFHLPFSRPRARARRFDSIVVLSNRQYSLWSKHYKRVEVIPNFITEFAGKKECDSCAQVVLSVGRMEEGDQKGFLRLIDIWEKVREDERLFAWKLCIIGDGEIKSEIESKIAQKGLQSSIKLKPFTTKIYEEYAKASIYAMSSYYEALPMVLLEAGSMGLALIAFDVNTGPSDVIESAKNLIENNDLQAYATRLQELMHSKSLRQECGARVQQCVEEKFSKAMVLKQWEELLDSL